MADNENLTPEIQRAIRHREDEHNQAGQKLRPWWLQRLRTHYHPNIEGLPDYGIETLKPETEAHCRDLCERNGFSYEDFRELYKATHQVIQARRKNPISTKLRGKGVCPINYLDESFRSYFQGAVTMKRQLRDERAQEVIREMADVN